MDSPYASRGKAEGSLPPPSFVRYLPQGEITYASRIANPHVSAPRRDSSPAQKAGLRFQRKVRDWAFGGAYLGKIEEGPWFAFEDASRRLHFCQPDFLFDDSRVVVVVEAKVSFSADAWYQLRKLYCPVLQKVLPRAAVIPLCVCKHFDPATVCPEEPLLVPDLMDCKPNSFNVLVLP